MRWPLGLVYIVKTWYAY